MTKAPIRERMKAWLASRSSTPWLVLTGAVLTLPSLSLGLMIDDYLHAIVLRRLPIPMPQHGPFDLFRFANGDPAMARVMMDRGQFAWTANPVARFGFFRPLSAATHVLDYAIWPETPWLMHAQSVAWYALAICSASAFYRRFLGATWIAGLALLLFAVDHTHATAVSWIAARNALVALTLGLPVLSLHDRWRRESWKPGQWLAPALLGTALLAGESAVAIVGYLVAHALHLEQRAWRARARALLPYLPVLVLWRAVYAALGYGVSGSGIYLDPARAPGAFLAALPRRLPPLLLGEFAFPPADAAVAYEYVAPGAQSLALVFALIVLVLLGGAMVPLWRRDAVARFFTTGLLLAAIPICAAFPANRLLLYVGIGAFGLIAQRIATPGGVASGTAATFLSFVHIAASPLLLAAGAASRFYDYSSDRASETATSVADIGTKRVVLVNPPNDSFAVCVPMSRLARGAPTPLHMWELASGTSEVAIHREAQNILRVRPAHGFLEHETDRLASDPAALVPGTSVQLTGLRVTVTESTADGRPAEALFEFDTPLEDPSLVWRRWNHDRFVPWTPPPVGESARLPGWGFRELLLDAEEKDRATDRATTRVSALAPSPSRPR